MGELSVCQQTIPGIKLMVDGPEPHTIAKTEGSSGLAPSRAGLACSGGGALSVFLNSAFMKD